MGKVRALLYLGAHNSFRARGRLAILVILFVAGLLARSTVVLVHDLVCYEVTRGLPPAYDLPDDWVAITYPERVALYELYKLGVTGLRDPVSGLLADYLYPEGPASITVLHADAVYRTSHQRAGSIWPPSIEGAWPTNSTELALPSHIAISLGNIGPGDSFELVETSSRQPVVFTVTGVFEARQCGYLRDMALSTAPASHDASNAIQFRSFFAGVAEGRTRSLSLEAAASAGAIVLTKDDLDLKNAVSSLVREIYETQSHTVMLGLGLVSVAVFTTLLVALAERRREVAVYRIIGMADSHLLVVLALELLLGLAIASVLTWPVLFAVAHLIFSGNLGQPSTIVAALLASLAWIATAAALGAVYPLALISVATPVQLLGGQHLLLYSQSVFIRRVSGRDPGTE